uniref:Uncharacterized protein n=1 Tax=Meloidogyne incognita TaxID=6306 RepID=A0A914M4K7_MELIC
MEDNHNNDNINNINDHTDHHNHASATASCNLPAATIPMENCILINTVAIAAVPTKLM